MAINLESLSPAELQTLIHNAEAQMASARMIQINEVRAKIDMLLKNSGLTLAEVYLIRSRKSSKGSKPATAPKYRNPENPAQTWSGRGKRPAWFAIAIKKRGRTAESLLIAASPKPATKKSPAKVKKMTSAKKKANT